MSQLGNNSVRPLRLTVAGSFGYGNAGDEGAPLAICDLARSLGYKATVDVLSRFNEPAESKVIGLGPRDTSRRRAIADQPLLFVGGGIVEPISRCTLWRIARWRHQAGVPYSALFGASVETGRRYGWSVRRRMQGELRLIRRLYTRDLPSQRTLAAIGTNRPVEAIGDVLLYLEPASEMPAPLHDLQGSRYIAVNLAPRWKDDGQWYPWITEGLAAVARRLDAGLAFIPCTQQFDRDQDEHEAVAQLLRRNGFDRPIVCLGDGYSPREIAAAFGDATLTIGMRLHACVMSYARRVPWLALAYHPKLSGFAETVEQSQHVLPPTLPASQSTQLYGYTFSALNLADCNLERAAMEAVESSSFHKLEPLRLRLAHALSVVIQEIAPVIAPIVEGIVG